MAPDVVGVDSGVTTVIDQGGASYMTLPAFRRNIADKARSRCYVFLSAYLVGGLEGQYYPNLYSPDSVDIDATVKSAVANRDPLRGIAASHVGGSGSWKWPPRLLLTAVRGCNHPSARRAHVSKALLDDFPTLWNELLVNCHGQLRVTDRYRSIVPMEAVMDFVSITA